MNESISKSVHEQVIPQKSLLPSKVPEPRQPIPRQTTRRTVDPQEHGGEPTSTGAAPPLPAAPAGGAAGWISRGG